MQHKNLFATMILLFALVALSACTQDNRTAQGADLPEPTPSTVECQEREGFNLTIEGNSCLYTQVPTSNENLREFAGSSNEADQQTPSSNGNNGSAGTTMIARELGPWAPTGDRGEDFEVTCNADNCEGTHVQLWWPAGSGQDWGKTEISSFIPPGLSIEVHGGAGRGWEYPIGYGMNLIAAEIADDNERRTNDTNFGGRVDIDDLIETGLVSVRFDRRAEGAKQGNANIPPASEEPSNSGVCEAIRIDNAENGTVTVPTGHTYVVDEAWESPINGVVVFEAGDKVVGYKGAVWDFPCDSDAVNAILKKQGKSPKAG